MYRLHDLNEHGVPSLEEGINTISDWNERRSDILKRWVSIIGEIPESVPAHMELNSETSEKGFIRQHISYNTVGSDNVTAYLLIPEKAKGKKSPAILALHGTNEKGKDSISTPDANKNRNYATELVKRGYIVLVPDALTAGERIIQNEKSFYTAQFYKEHPKWLSITAKNIADHRQGIDVLTRHELVDENRIGVIGHSFGGYNAYYLGGIDERIKAIVTSCGFSTFTGDYRPHQWAERDWYTHFPKLTGMIEEGEVPFEFHEILSLVVPKPLFNWSAQHDAIFPHWKSIGSGLDHVYRVYEKLRYPEHFISLMGAGSHDFPVHIREAAYQFLDKWLDHSIENGYSKGAY